MSDSNPSDQNAFRAASGGRSPSRHFRGSGNPVGAGGAVAPWVPAFAGMTNEGVGMTNEGWG
jgi:hypothetical protein